jgi:hypothetical protein
VCPNFVKDFDKALSKYCVFDLFSAIKHIKQKKFEEIQQYYNDNHNGIWYMRLTLPHWPSNLQNIVYVNFQPIKIFHDADQPIRFPVHQMDGNPTV